MPENYLQDVDPDQENSIANFSSSSRHNNNEKAILARIWGNFDTRYMKPLLTHSRPTLLETLPVFCNPVARLLTTTEQLTQENAMHRSDSDSEICINNDDIGIGGIDISTNNRNGPRGSISRIERGIFF